MSIDSTIKLRPDALAQVSTALEQYKREVHNAGLAQKTQTTYIRHAETFVRWLRGDFVPGSRIDLSSQPRE